MFAKEAFDKLVQCYNFQTVLDVGSGAGLQSKAFKDAGKTVTAVDLGKSVYFNRSNKNYDGVELITSDFDTWCKNNKGNARFFDVVWCSHILEHQVNPNLFLKECLKWVEPGRGLLVVTVPPLKHSIVGGHVTLWNAGLLLYHLILAGLNCRGAAVKTYGYNISVIVQNRMFPKEVMETLHHDAGDIVRLKEYFPIDVKEGFDGRIAEVNW